MKLLILADSNSPHTFKWVNSLSKELIEILLFTLSKNDINAYTEMKNVKIISSDFKDKKRNEPDFNKIAYLKYLPKLVSAIRDFKPDIIHAHYVSSYGLLGALTGFHPFFISSWGTDVLKFPNKSFLHRIIIKFIFKRADRIFATSNFLGRETEKYTEKKIKVIPFGIDTGELLPVEKKI